MATQLPLIAEKNKRSYSYQKNSNNLIRTQAQQQKNNIVYKHNRSASVQQYVDAQALKQLRNEKGQRQNIEREAQLLKNRVVLLQRQQQKEQRNLESAKQQAEELYNMKKKIQQDKNQMLAKKLELEKEKECHIINQRNQKILSQNKQQDIKIQNQQQKQLEGFLIRQIAQIDNIKRQQLNDNLQNSNKLKRDQQLQREKYMQEQKANMAKHNINQVQNEMIQEQTKLQELNEYKKQLEKMEQNLVSDLLITKSERKEYIQKVQDSKKKDYQYVKEQFPDINKKLNVVYKEENNIKPSYQSPYNQRKIYDQNASQSQMQNSPQNKDEIVINNTSNVSGRPISVISNTQSVKSQKSQSKKSDRSIDNIPVKSQIRNQEISQVYQKKTDH